MTIKDKILNKAIEISEALYDPYANMRCQHFCFLIYKSRFIIIGKNSKKTHPINLKNPKYSIANINISSQKGSCAELNALLKLKHTTNIQPEKCSMINIRIDNNGYLGYSKPCHSCISLLNFFSIKDVIYFDTDFGCFKKL